MEEKKLMTQEEMEKALGPINEPSPYGALDLPPYQMAKEGKWTLMSMSLPMVRGYFTGLRTDMPLLWVLKEYRFSKKPTRIWMSITPMERESLVLHARQAHGHVVLAGLGMGLLLYNIAKKKEVTRVDVIERDQRLIDMLPQMTDLRQWPGWEKVNLIRANAFSWKPSSPPDFLSVDIWLELGTMSMMRDTRRVQDQVKAKEVAIWGQELEFISWCDREGKRPESLTHQDYLDFVKESNLPLMMTDDDQYHKHALTAATHVTNY